MLDVQIDHLHKEIEHKMNIEKLVHLFQKIEYVLFKDIIHLPCSQTFRLHSIQSPFCNGH